jgi:hypothetical protein
MGLLDVASAYEKMLQNPENRGSSAGNLNQSSPSMSEAQGGGSPPPAPKIEDSDDLWMKEIDKRMANKTINEATGNTSTNMILNELKEMKKMMKMVMDVNLRLLEKLK